MPLASRALRLAGPAAALAALDYLLLQRRARADTELCNLRAHLLAIRDDALLENRKETAEYKNMLAELSAHLHNAYTHHECRIKSLELLSLEDNTQMLIINEEFHSDLSLNEWMARELIRRIKDSHEVVKHMFLESLIRLTKKYHEEFDPRCLLIIYRTMYDCSSGDNATASRAAVVGFYEDYYGREVDTSKFQPAEKCEFAYSSLFAYS